MAPLPIADHHDVPVSTVQVTRPELRRYQRAAKLTKPGELGLVALVVVVITSAQIEKAAAIEGSSLVRLRLYGPRGTPARPGGRRDAAAEADVLLDSILGGDRADIAADLFSRREDAGLCPGPEGITEAVHVGVGAHARVAKEVPGTTNRVPRFQNQEVYFWKSPSQSPGCADAG